MPFGQGKRVSHGALFTHRSHGGCAQLAAQKLLKFVISHREGGTDGHVHVEVLVGAESTAKEGRVLSLRTLAVFEESRSVVRRIHGVVRLILTASIRA